MSQRRGLERGAGDLRRLDNDVEVILDEGKVVVGAPEILISRECIFAHRFDV